METFDVIIVGGGPAGSSCAWKLQQAGLHTLVLDKRRFPRGKPCAGWITPQVAQALQLNRAEYCIGRTWQVITGFRCGVIGGDSIDVRYDKPISFGIRRCEFDTYLLNRAGGEQRLEEPVERIERQNERWIINGAYSAPLVVGAGGNFCPVARLLGARESPASTVVAQEGEFKPTGDGFGVAGDTPALYFCRDLAGYGWCFRKGEYLNVGLGRTQSDGFPAHVAQFRQQLREHGIADGDGAWKGHAYQLYDGPAPRLFDDGMNMIIPIDTYSSYQAARTNIAIPQNRILSLNGKTGLHPAMTGIHNLFNEGKVSIVQAVGYPQPDFSHFRATDIYMSASDSNQFVNSGWMGRYLSNEFPGFPNGYPNSTVTDPLGIQIGSVTSLTFQGPQVSMGMSISDPTNFYNLVNGIQDPAPNSPAGNELTYIRTVARQTQQYSDVIKNAALKVTQQATYPTNNTLADQLKIVARLVKGGLKTRVYMVSIGGFDTHSTQVNSGDTTTGAHATLLQRVSDAIKAFMDDLKFLGVSKRILGMTFSEFGRRIKSNSSVGTDHGAAAPVILFGDYVNPSVIGNNPAIPSNVNVNDNIPMQYDFRSIYASVLEKWFCVDSTTLQTVMLKNFQSLNVVKSNSCNSNVPDLSDKVIIKNYPNPFTDSTTISFITEGGHTSVMIMDMLGRAIKTLIDQEYTAAGQYTVSFNTEKLASGVYYARLQNGAIQQVRAMLKVR